MHILDIIIISYSNNNVQRRIALYKILLVFEVRRVNWIYGIAKQLHTKNLVLKQDAK